MKEIKAEILYPKWNDARWLLLLFLFSFVFYALSSPGFTRTPEQFLAAIFLCIGLDALLLMNYKKILLLPMSALISSMGTVLLTDSATVWAYALVATLAILSKHFITVNGRHVFNPNNFGIVIATLFFSSHITTAAGRWGGSVWGAAIIACLGIAVVYRANRLVLTLTYASAFLCGAFVRSIILDRPLLGVAAPMTGAAFQLFIFYMITDPLTSPKRWKAQIFYGISLAVIDNFMRFYQVKNAPFYSLFIMTAIYSYTRLFNEEEKRNFPWKLGVVRLET